MLQTPIDPATGARFMRLRCKEIATKLLIGFAVPDRAEGLGEEVTEDNTLIIVGSKRGNTTGQTIAIGRNIGGCPRT